MPPCHLVLELRSSTLTCSLRCLSNQASSQSATISGCSKNQTRPSASTRSCAGKSIAYFRPLSRSLFLTYWKVHLCFCTNCVKSGKKETSAFSYSKGPVARAFCRITSLSQKLSTLASSGRGEAPSFGRPPGTQWAHSMTKSFPRPLGLR